MITEKLKKRSNLKKQKLKQEKDLIEKVKEDEALDKWVENEEVKQQEKIKIHRQAVKNELKQIHSVGLDDLREAPA